jgi:hypothetical protein
MLSNDILDEIHEVRRQILANYAGDLGAYLRDAEARLVASGRPIIRMRKRFGPSEVSQPEAETSMAARRMSDNSRDSGAATDAAPEAS